MKTCPKLCIQKGNGKRSDYAFVNIPDPEHKGKRKRIRFGHPEDPNTHIRYQECKLKWKAGEVIFPSTATPQTAEPEAEPRPMKLMELFQKWLEANQGVYTASPTGVVTTWEQQRRVALMLAEYKDIPVDDFTVVMLRQFQRKLDESGKYKMGTVNTYVGYVKAAYAWGRAEGYVSREAANDIASLSRLQKGRCKSKPNSRRKSVPPEVVAKTLPHLKPQQRLIIELLMLTGARPGEICSMRVEDIDRTSTPWVYWPLHHKNEWKDQERAIPLGPKAREKLTEWIKTRGIKSGYLFPVIGGRGRQPKSLHYTSEALRYAIIYVNKTYGYPKWSPYQCRHTVAMQVKKQFDPSKAQKALGHKSLNTTELYFDMDLQEAKEVFEVIG